MTLDECFSILGIDPTESKSEIKSAYRDLLFVWHPDRFPNDSKLQAKAGEKLKEINEAYKLLRGGPQSLDRIAAFLRWNPVIDSCRAVLPGHLWVAAQR
jgi:hypothetical protein